MQQGERRPDIAFAAKNDFRELAQILRARSWASATHVGTLQSRADCTVDDIEAEGGFVPDWRISRIPKSYIFSEAVGQNILDILLYKNYQYSLL